MATHKRAISQKKLGEMLSSLGTGDLGARRREQERELRKLLSALDADPARSSHWAEQILRADFHVMFRQVADKAYEHPAELDAAAELEAAAAQFEAVADIQFGLAAAQAFCAASDLSGEDLDAVQERMQRLADAARQAAAPLSRNSPPRRRGRRSKAAAKEIRSVAARAFEAATGTRPGRIVRDGISGGPFVEFLEAVFAVMGIDASADAQARAYSKK